jgi:hypothetical protein
LAGGGRQQLQHIQNFSTIGFSRDLGPIFIGVAVIQVKIDQKVTSIDVGRIF